MLNIHHIVKHFDTLTALDNVSFEIVKGDFFGLLGPNGAGKSTLMNIIIGYLEADNGSIYLGDEKISTSNIGIRKKIGYVPQDISLYSDLSAYKNLKIFGELYNLTGKALNIKIDEVLELVQLIDRKKDKINTFSGGMKRRMNLAASLLHDPEIILCDEPTVGVDPQSRNAVFDMLQLLNKMGKTIVYTTHYMEEAERLCNRLAIIDHGKIIAQGSLMDLINMLNQKDTIKIQKTALTTNLLPKLKTVGNVIEMDFVYELAPSKEYNKISKVFEFLEGIGIANHLINISRATLEDVFLNLTGRSLRD